VKQLPTVATVALFGGAVVFVSIQPLLPQVGRSLRPRERLTRVKQAARRWLVRDRAWVGRLAARLGAVRIEGCWVRIDSSLINDGLKSRLFYRRYERTERQLLRRHLDPSLPVVELGGGMGVVACVVNSRLSKRDQHVVVEANPAMLPLIRRNRAANGAAFELIHGAIAYGRSHVALNTTSDLLGSRTGEASGGDVPTLQLSSIIHEKGFLKCTLICDIEGTEIDLVAHELPALQARVLTIVLEEHPEYCPASARAGMFEKLMESGFDRVDSLRKVHVLRNRLLENQLVQAIGPVTGRTHLRQ
jgi:FkbM family methyltransferase